VGAGEGAGTGRRRTTEEDDDDQDFPTVHKLEFPKYNGSSDPLPWLNRCDHYFKVPRAAIGTHHNTTPSVAYIRPRVHGGM
jgi:hypothetical protein